MTGLTAPHEEPKNPELIVNTNHLTLNQCVDQLIDFLLVSKIISSRSPNGKANKTALKPWEMQLSSNVPHYEGCWKCQNRTFYEIIKT